jgi:2-dehydro-3-deoxygluconokinase
MNPTDRRIPQPGVVPMAARLPRADRPAPVRPGRIAPGARGMVEEDERQRRGIMIAVAPDRPFVSVGECMIEISVGAGGEAGLAYGGDTLNTAVYAARQGLGVSYATALGDDPYSDAMIGLWQAEGIATDLVLRLPGRLPGLYAIRTDDSGERSFHYWRDRAPARDLFDLPEGARVAGALSRAGLVYFSGITLSLYSESGRDRFHRALADAKAAGATIAFDGNFRPRGWPDRATARSVFERFLTLVDVALPTAEDERMLFGDADAAAVARRLAALGVGEIAVKDGAAGALVASAAGVGRVPVPEAVRPVDTTAAGDSFNAGYLAGRIAGLGPEAAARRGHCLAGAVIRHKGALIPAAAMPALDRPEETAA